MLKVTRRTGSPLWQITGTVQGVRVRQSAGTDDWEAAQKIRLRIEHDILYGKALGVKTVADAILSYMENGGDDRFLFKVNEALGAAPLDGLTQGAIDKAAREAYPGYKRGKNGKTRPHSPATIKRQFYIPLAAVLHYAHESGMMPNYMRVRMPKTSRPAPKWANESWFKAFLAVADDDLRSIIIFLMGTGCRISEALNLRPSDIDLEAGEAYVRTTKNGEPRMAALPGFVIDELKDRMDGETVFPFRNRFAVNGALERTCKKAGIEYLSTHKVGSHTFATQLARLAGMDAKALTATGRWKDPKSTYHYTHYLKKEQADKADSLKKLLGK